MFCKQYPFIEVVVNGACSLSLGVLKLICYLRQLCMQDFCSGLKTHPRNILMEDRSSGGQSSITEDVAFVPAEAIKAYLYLKVRQNNITLATFFTSLRGVEALQTEH